MNLLVVGSGGREHALCWRLAASPLLSGLWCAPGNAGIENEARCVALDPMDFDGLVAFCREESIDFVVVGPEAPLPASWTGWRRRESPPSGRARPRRASRDRSPS